MNKKKIRKALDLEFFGSVSGLVLILCVIAAFLEIDSAPGFFVLISGMGILVNGILAGLKFIKKRYILGTMFTVITLALLIFFAVQLITVERFLR